jgi:hypothetical protein
MVFEQSRQLLPSYLHVRDQNRRRFYMTCPSSSTLVACAFETDEVNDVARQHAASCALCASEIERLREAAALLARMDRPGNVTDTCLSEVALAQMASSHHGALHTDVVTHLAECTRCRTRFAGAVSALSSKEISSELTRLDAAPLPLKPHAFGKHAGYAVLAAAIAGLIILPQLGRQSTGGQQRAPQDLRDRNATITMTTPPTILAPKGTVAAASVLTWTRVPGADEYSVTVFSDGGDVLFELQASDTSVAVPQQSTFPAGQRLLWKVRARTGFDRWVESDLVEFRVIPARGDG